VLQGGHELCRVEGFDRRKAVSELKASIEAEAGLVPALTRLINSESGIELQDHLTLEDAGMPNEQALAQGVIQLHAQKLKKVVVADELQIAPGEVTDSKLAVLCGSIRDDPPDILGLRGCRFVTNISCLVQLSTISHLDISRCNFGAIGGFHLAGVIKEMGALLSLDMSDNDLGYEEVGKALGGMLATNSTLQQLNLSNNFANYGSALAENKDRPAEFAEALSVGLRDNGAISSVNVLGNRLGKEGVEVLGSAWQNHSTLKTICGALDQLDLSGKLGNDLPVVLVELKYNGALTVLILKDNKLASIEAGKALAEALARNSTLKELDVSSNNWNDFAGTGITTGGDGPGFATELAVGIRDNGALSIANVMGNCIGKEVLFKLQEIMRSKPSLISLCGIADGVTEADLSGIGMDADDTIVIVSELPEKGALLSLNLSNCMLVSESSNVQSHQTLKVGELIEHEGKMRPVSAEWDGGYRVHIFDVFIDLANAFPDMGALLSLDISSNSLFVEGTKLLAKALESNQTMTSLNVSSNMMTYDGKGLGDMSGVAALADVIPGMGSLSVLSLEDNMLLTAESGKILSDMVATNTVLKELDLSSNNWKNGLGRLQGDGPGFAQELAVGIRDNGSLIKLDISNNSIGAEQKGGLQRISVASGIDLAM
jgi:Ran GTPase-activating protein (RanGAP) involved in mRNA processing and transport